MAEDVGAVTSVAELLKERREELGLSPTELNRQAKLSIGHVSKLEGGQYGMPTDKTIDKINAVLGLTRQHFYAAGGKYQGAVEKRPASADAALMVQDITEMLELAERIVAIARRSSRKRVVRMQRSQKAV